MCEPYEKIKIKALYQLILLNVFEKKKKTGNELEKKLHSRKVDQNRPNGPSRLKWTKMGRMDYSRQNKPNRPKGTEIEASGL